MRLKLTLSLVLLVGFATAASPASASAGHCGGFDTVLGCPQVGGEVGDGGATLSGDRTVPGAPGGSGGRPGGSGGTAAPPRPCDEVFAGLCYGDGLSKPGEPDPGIPPLTLSDIAHFTPQPATQRMQPDGWMVVGLDTNFYALIDRHVVTGTLLGESADVRFTPVAYRWRYGDGSAARLTTKGAPWSAQGLSEFDPTATSHVYRASGTYVIDLDVEYTAEYRFAGGGWISLSGTIVVPANRLIATAAERAVTVLVDRHCAQPPAGPGC